GRVNILKALIFDKWPKLSYIDQSESILNDDGDSILNPGETINLIIELKNDTGWTTASNVQGVLRSSNEGITILDSIGTWISIPENTVSSNTDNGFTIQFSNTLVPANYDFELVLVANDSGELPYKKTILLDVSLSLDQKGFPFYASTSVEASPLFVDIDDDGKQEIIFGDKSGELYVVDHTGDTLDGFPITLGSQLGGIAVADIDLDDTLEIVTTSFFNKKIEVVDVMGNREWTRHTNLFITAMPAIGNIDNDPELEVVVGSYDQNIYALNHDSTDVIAFPYATGQLLHGGVSLADVNADGLDDIVYGDKSGQCSIVLADGTTPIGWPVSTSGSITSEPQVIVTGDHSAIILIGNDNGDMYGFDIDGTQRFMIDGSGAIYASPAIYVSEDNIFAFFGTTSGDIYKIDVLNGTLESNWPKRVSRIDKSLALVDVLDDAEDKAQILAMGNDGYIYAFDMEGNRVQGYPLNTGLLSKSGLAVTDIDDDGDNDLISGNYSGLSVIDLKNFAGTIYWSMHRGSADRKGSITKILTSIDDVNIPEEFELKLIGNAPNPFNPMTTISYRINDIIPLDLRIYSLDGKLVLSRQITNPEYGINEININMTGFSSGIYLYSLESGNEIRKAKMIYLK
ncbi:MAG: T9SS type A sorting domain-containing protein, partial [Candidatus Marinimicrobia bacterium]|nr:T9SS type A sorting domain-containing protein [Candidatus Neomarinimicrobiota bacterium]